MINKIFIEKDIQDSPYALRILSHFPKAQRHTIERYDEIFGRVKKPYLHKRDNLSLFIAKKRGEKVKEAPVAYGYGTEKHYYFVHAYNCIYECEYCYLQGHFDSPDLVLFVNHDEIIQEMQEILNQNQQGCWFHAGEYSDSLALNRLTNELDIYWKFFEQNPQAKLELRSKSSQISQILQLKPLDNIVVSFSLSTQSNIEEYDKKTASLEARIRAIRKLINAGFYIGLHFDPVIYHDSLADDFRQLCLDVSDILQSTQLRYISIGVVRFSKQVGVAVESHYPNSRLLAQDLVKSFDGKQRYPLIMRKWILNTLKNTLISSGTSSSKIYLCMEELI